MIYISITHQLKRGEILTSNNFNYSYEEIFQRNIGIHTEEMQELLRKSTVAIAGVGGVGGTTAEALVRMGIGSLKIADSDVYEVHNINRQVGALNSTLGKRKTDVMYERLKNINPYLKAETYPEGVTLENIAKFIQGANAVVDAVDYYVPDIRLAIHQGARKNKQYVFCPPAGGFGVLVLCFDSESPSIEDFLEYPKDPKKIKDYQVDPKKFIGCELDYLPEIFFKTFKKETPYVSTNGATVMLAGAVTSVQIIKALMYKEQQRDSNKFKEYGKIKLITVPHALRIDGWGEQYCLKANFNK